MFTELNNVYLDFNVFLKKRFHRNATQPQIIESWEFMKNALVLLPIVTIHATNKFGMILVKEVDIFQ